MSAQRNWFASLAIAMLGVGCLSAQDKNDPLPKKLFTARAVVMDLQPKIVERGTLEARDNNYVKCEVKASSRGAPKLKWVVENRSQVKKGDLIVDIDASLFREQAAIAKITLDAAGAEVVAAENLLKLKQEARDEVKAAEADLKKKRAILARQEAMYKDLLEQIGKCKIRAPATGIVVYYVPGRSSLPFSLEPGTPVMYSQKLLSIPDPSHLLVKVRIAEAFIKQVKVGQPCEIRVDAIPGKRLKGAVKQVAKDAAPQDWMSPDVRVYQTILEITDPVQDLKLKPDFSATCEIVTEPPVKRALAIPIRAILMLSEKNKKPRCLIVTPRGTEAREVELGVTDGQMVEIKAGLKEGDEVVTNPRLPPGPAPRPAR